MMVVGATFSFLPIRSGRGYTGAAKKWFNFLG
jgi:hypothetical protein